MNVKQDPTQTSLKDSSIPNILENKVLKELSSNSHENIEQNLRLSRSKLPRIVKTKSNNYPSKCKSFEKRQNESGDTKPGSSQSSRSPPSRDESYSEGEKLKPSQIPRRRVNSCVAPTEQSNSKRPFPKSNFMTDTKNVQRLHVLNTFQDFCTDRPPASVGCSRPIPTLGRIYQRSGNTSISDWFIETDSSFVETLSVSIDADQSVSVNESTGNAVEGSLCAANSDIMSKPLPLQQPAIFNEQPSQKIGVTKENICQWSNELEYPTRDSESRHGTTSPKVRSNNQLGLPIAKESEKVFVPNVVPNEIDSPKFVPPSDTSKSNSTGKKLKEQSTVILVERARPSVTTFMRRLRPDTSMTLTQTSDSEFSKTFQFPSNPNKINGTFAISYVDCASEVLQKTTDFETADKDSSRGTFENIDMLEEDGSMWSCTRDEDSTNLFSSSEDCSKSEHTTVTKGKESDSSGTLLLSSGYNHRYSYFCIKNRNILRMRSDVDSHRKCFFHRNKGRKEIEKFKERRSTIPRKRLSFRRMCRRHWNYVCQKTAERWANWPRSSVKFKKFRMLYLHTGINWEDVDVQTVSAICRDNATATIIKELRSNGIATSLRLSHLKTDTATSGKSLTLSMLKNFQPPLQRPSLAYAVPTLQENNPTLNCKCQSHHTETKCKEINLPIYRACDSFSSRFYSNIQTGKKADDVLVPKSVSDGTQSEADNTDSQDSQLFSVESKVTVLSCADSLKRATEDKSTHTIGSMKRSSNKSNKSVSRHGSCLSKTVFKSNDDLAKFNKNSSVLSESVIKSSWAGSKNQQNSGKASLASSIVESKGGTEFSFKPNSESTKTAAYLSSLYSQPQAHPSSQAFPKMISFSAEANAPNLTKVCQTGPSSSWVHFLCHRSTSMGQNMCSPSPHSTGVTTSYLASKKSVETETENVSKSSSETLDRISAGFTTSSIFPVKITKGTSGSRMDTILKKDASIETIPPTMYLGFKGPKIISISSGLLPTISSASTSIKCKTQSIGIPSNEVKLHEKEVLPPSLKRSRAWNLICCGTDTTSDVERCSRSTIVESSDLEIESEMKNKTSKSSFIGGSLEVPIVNVLTTKYVPACINTESMQKCVGVGPSRIFPETTLKLDFCAQPSPYKEDIVRGNRSTAISCNMAPDVVIAEISTQTDKPPVIPCHDQETLTVQEPLWSAASECGKQPYDTQFSPDAEELLMSSSICTTNRDQIISTEKPENDYDQNGKDCGTALTKPSPKASEPRPPSPRSSGARPPSPKPSGSKPPSPKASISRPPSPRPLTESGPVCASLGVTCVACFKPKVSSPFLPLSKNVSKEKVHKMLSTEKEITNVAMTQSGSAGDMSMARPQEESNEHNDSDISTAPSPPELQEEPTGALGFTCITCLKTQKSSPLLSPFKNVSNENTNKLLTSEKNVISTVMRHGTETKRSNKSLKGTVAQTAIEVQDAATDPCSCERKSENVFTSRFLLAAPQPCRHAACHQSTECLYVYEQPHCVIHRKLKDVIVQMQPSQRDVVLAAMSVPQSACSVATPESPVLQGSTSQITDLIGLIDDSLDVTPLMVKDKATNTDESYHFLPTIAFAAPQASLHSFGVLTSNSVEEDFCTCDRAGVSQSDPERGRKHEEIVEVYTQTSSFDDAIRNMPRSEDGSIHPLEGYLTSCRYYGSLLTSKLNRVKENLTKRLTPSDETIYEAYDTQEGCVLSNAEACTMKPSGRNEFCGQADFPKRKIVKTVSCFVLGHAYSVTDFGRGHEEDNLNAVYCMLSAIEGRIRRLKRNTFTYR